MTKSIAFTLVALAGLSLAGCTDEPSPSTGFGNPTYPVPPPAVGVGRATTTTTATPTPTPTPTPSPRQIERFGRPAINEGLLFTNNLLNTWNSVPPSADLTAAAQPIAAEATAVLAALGNSQSRINALFGALLPDVMRIDTTRVSGYAGTPSSPFGNLEASTLRPIGGRMLTDDVIDATLILVVPGGADPSTPAATPIPNLESDNVGFTYTNGGQATPNHQPIQATFPYLARPN